MSNVPMTTKAPTPPTPPAKPKNKLVWSGGGAAAGFLLGGPVGAVIGGGLGYLFSSKK